MNEDIDVDALQERIEALEEAIWVHWPIRVGDRYACTFCYRMGDDPELIVHESDCFVLTLPEQEEEAATE